MRISRVVTGKSGADFEQHRNRSKRLYRDGNKNSTLTARAIKKSTNSAGNAPASLSLAHRLTIRVVAPLLFMSGVA